jgi:transketolase
MNSGLLLCLALVLGGDLFASEPATNSPPQTPAQHPSQKECRQAGALVHKAIMAAQSLQKEGIAAKVVNLATIKPLDEQALWTLANETGAVVTVEEHQVHGGMGSAVAECLAQHAPVPMEFIGVQDQFGQSGTPAELIELYGMGIDHIIAAVRKVLLRKKK